MSTTSSNWKELLKSLQGRLGCRLAVPKVGRWEVEAEDGGRCLHLAVEATVLDANIQADGAASPTFLWVLGWWLRRHLDGTAVRTQLTVTGSPTVSPALRRSAFLLHEYERAIGDRFKVELAPQLAWRWPEEPVFNVEQDTRDAESGAKEGSEAWFENWLCQSEAALVGFNDGVPEAERIERFQRQLPIGLFDGKVRGDADHRWTPGGKSAIDAWALSKDGKCIHLFELKVGGNAKLGIIPEAFYYASMVRHVRDNAKVALAKGRKDGGLRAVREKNPRIVMWLVAPSFHPLVLGRGRSDERVSPLQDLNREGVEFRILPYQAAADGSVSRWRWEDSWGVPRSA